MIRNSWLCVLFSLLVACGGRGGAGDAGIFGDGNADDGNGTDNVVTITGTSPGNYVWTSLAAGTQVYIDRDYTYTSVPTAYRGFQVLQTANDDKLESAGSFIRFEINQPATVYVAHDAQPQAAPSWLRDTNTWTPIGERLVSTDTTLNIYAGQFSAGTVVLGGNEGDSESSNYVVLIDAGGEGGNNTGGTTGGGNTTGGGGNSGGGTTVDGGVNALAVSLSAGTGTVRSGESVSLTWSAPEADTCQAAGGWEGNRPTSGSTTVGPLNNDVIFELRCEGADGTGGAAAYVTVRDPLNDNVIAEIQLSDYTEQTGPSLAGRPVTLGVPLAEGGLQPGETLVVTKADGTVLASQWNPLAYWRTDDTVLHGAITFQTPDTGDASGTYHIQKGTPFNGTPITKADVANSNFDAAVEVTLGQSVYSLSAQSLLDGVITPRQDYTHFTGPLVSEFVLGGPLRLNGTGTEHGTLQAYFYIRSYGPANKVYVTISLENTGAFNTLQDISGADVDVRVGNVAVVSKSSFTIHADVRYQSRSWWNNNPELWASLDVEYIQGTKLVPEYRDIVIDETTLADFVVSSDWNQKGFISDSQLHSGGGKAELAPYDRWTAAYLISGDRRAWNAMRAAQDLYTCCMSYKSGSGLFRPRDENTGMPVDLQVHDKISDVWGDPGAPNTFNASGAASTPITTDLAHYPAIGYITYLLTAESSELENLLFSAVSVWLNEWPGGHDGKIPNKGWGPKGQVRGMAWGLREMVNGGTITPSHHPLRSTMVAAVDNALKEMNSKGKPLDTEGLTGLWLSGPSDDAAIVYTIGDSGRVGVALWQDDWLTWAVGTVVERGWRDSVASGLWAWKAKAVVSRFSERINDTGYCWQYASAYNVRVMDSEVGPPYSTWDQIYNNNFGGTTCNPRGGPLLTDDQNSRDLGAQIAPALATAASSNIVGAEAAWIIYNDRITPDWGPNDSSYEKEPEWAITER